ncbi:MAG: AI-2E family transporter [Acidimicrobiia bacterium]
MAEIEVTSVFRRVGIFSWSVIGVMLLTAAGFFVLIRGRIILAPLLLAVLIIFILNPLVSWLHRKGIPRFIGVILGFFVFFSSVTLLAVLLLPDIVKQAQSFVDTFPALYDDSITQVKDLLASAGFETTGVWNYDQLVAYLNDPENRNTLISLALDRLGSVTAGIFEFILVFLLGPVLAFYFLIDLPSVQKRMVDVFPERRRAEAAHVGRQLNTALGGFLRGQLVVALIVGIMLSFGYRIIGLQFWLLIGLIGGLLNIVPFLGPWVGGFLGILVAVTTADVGTAVWALVVAVVVQQIDNNFVSPTVLRATVRLHPSVTLLALVIGGAFAGIWGVVVAVPLTAILKIIVGHWWRTRILDQTWEEASEAMFEEPEPSRLLRTGEVPIVEPVHDEVGPESTDGV